MNKRPVTVSIVLPTHNRANVLGFAIRSALKQSMPHFELLVVGDGCTDNTAEVVQSFADPRIRWLDLPKAPNFGYANRNHAFRNAQGEFVAFLAHDDLLFPDHLSMLTELAVSSGADLVYSRPLWISRDGLVTPSYFNLEVPTVMSRFLSQQDNEIPASCFLFRHSCFERYGYWDESLLRNGDWDYWARIIKTGGTQSLRFLPMPTSMHFLASWRSPEQIPSNIYFRQRLAEHGIEDFPVFRLPVETESCEQEYVWRQLESGGNSWVESLRCSCQQVLSDQAVWLSKELEAASGYWMAREGKLQQELNASKLERQGSVTELKCALEKLHAIESSMSWKFAVKLQQLRQKVAPSGSNLARIWDHLKERL